MSGSLLEIRDFATCLKIFASSTGHHQASSFAEAVYESGNENNEPIDSRSMQRWMQGKGPPSGDEFNQIISFLVKEGKFSENLADERYVHFLNMYHEAKKKPSPQLETILRRKPAIEFNEFTDYGPLSKILIVDHHHEIADIISNYAHSKETNFRLKEIINICSDNNNYDLQEKIARIILDCGRSNSDRRVASICVNALCSVDIWQPAPNTFEELQLYFKEKIITDRLDCFTTLSTLSFALARNGCPAPIQTMLGLLFHDQELAEAEFQVISSYYGDEINQLASIRHHFKEPKRKGLMIAHDTHRLMRLKERFEGPIRDDIIKLLRLSAAYMVSGGLRDEGNSVAEYSSI